MKVEEFFIKGKSYRCTTDTLKETRFFYGDIYHCPRNGQLTNSIGVDTFMSDVLIKAFELVEKSIKEDKVNHPKHYTDGPKIILERDYKEGEVITIECINVIRDMPAWKANIIKYLWRAGKKSEEGYSISDKEIEDIKKAQFYLNNKLKEIELKKKYNV